MESSLLGQCRCMTSRVAKGVASSWHPLIDKHLYGYWFKQTSHFAKNISIFSATLTYIIHVFSPFSVSYNIMISFWDYLATLLVKCGHLQIPTFVESSQSDFSSLATRWVTFDFLLGYRGLLDLCDSLAFWLAPNEGTCGTHVCQLLTRKSFIVHFKH